MSVVDIIKENYAENYPKPVTLKTTEKIIEQMKNNVCKIYLSDGSKGTGFFCKLPYNQLKVLITNNHVIDEKVLKGNEKILISINNEKKKEIELKNRIKYTNKEYDVTIIEIKEKDEINNYLELDENIIENISNMEYIKETIYIIEYEGNEKEVSVSYGIIKGIDIKNKYTFEHISCTEKGSSGSPILNMKTNKVIGIHKEVYKNKNRGTFLNYVLQDFINKNLIKEFNEKYKLNIKDNNIKELDLSWQYIGNEGLELLSKIEFKNLKELNLFCNQISDIKILEKVKFEQLEILNFSNNKISDIKILEKVNFKNLKKLDLSWNKISDIKILEKVKFEKLEILNLSGNEISNINILEKVNFKNLKKLYLCNNRISDGAVNNSKLKNIIIIKL